MVGYYYKTGADIYSILRFMKNCLDLSYKPSASSIEVVNMYADKKYRFSFFLNERKEIIYLIEQLDDDTTDYFKEEKKMTKEEALKKIEELKAFVEKLDSEIPGMNLGTNSNTTVFLGKYDYGVLKCYRDCVFESNDTRDCYILKAFELAHLMYAREYLGLNVIGGEYDASWILYFDKNLGKYQLSRMTSVMGRMDCTNPYTCGNKEDAFKIMQYMNKYVKDKVKELY